MKKLAADYYKDGYNCCEAIIMSANTKYKLNISKEQLKFASCINNGMGVGNMCSTVIGGIMVIGYIFEKKHAPEHSNINHIRMRFIDDVNNQFKSVNCSQIKKNQMAVDNCSYIISIIAMILDNIIAEFI